jgi:hypothetical protein
MNHRENRLRTRTIRIGSLLLSAVGLITVASLVIGAGIDVASFDRTSGGYEYPYEGWSGTPIDFDEWYTTADGMYQKGRVIDLYADCSTGMVSWSVLGMPTIEWREFSDRAKAVHEPQVACEERGFDTSVWDGIGT